MRRILHKFKLSEISSVDRPAQAGAKMVLMKRDDLAVAKGAFVEALRDLKVEDAVRQALDGLWDTQAALREAICEIIEDPEEYPDTKAAITEALAEFSAEVQAIVTAAKGPVAAAAGDGTPPDDSKPTTDDTNKREDQMDKTLEQAQVELEAALARATRAEAFGKLNDLEKAHYNSLPGDEQEAFLKMDRGARANVLEKAAAANPVVYTTADGVEFRKNDDPRLVSMAKQNDEDRKIAKAAMERADTMEFEKRADDELGNLPGEKAAKVALLKAINGISDEAVRTSIGQLIKAGNDAMSAAFGSRGTAASPVGDAEAQLDALAKARAKEKGLTFEKAYAEVLETNEGAALYAKL